MKLYEIDQEIEALIDPETGELVDENAFETLQMARQDKIENLVLWLKNLTAEAKAVKEEADILLDRQRKLVQQAERLKDYIRVILDGEKFKTPRCSVSYRASESVEIEDSAALLKWAESNHFDDCIRYKTPEISKTAVKERLKSGQAVPGARICKNRNLVVK